MDQLNPQILNITKAIAYTENGGAPDTTNLKAGKTGEMKSVFQFEPGTWKAYSQQVFGKQTPMTPESESVVTYKKIADWYGQDIKDGYSAEEATRRALSRWNAGAGEPDAYTGSFSDGTSSSGTNQKYGVKYDVSGYVNKAMDYMKKFGNQTPASPTQSNAIGGQTTPQTMTQPTTQTATPQPTAQPTQPTSPTPQTPIQQSPSPTTPNTQKETPTAMPSIQNTGLIGSVVKSKKRKTT